VGPRLSALDRKMSVGDVLGRDGLVPFNGGSLLFHLEIAQHRDEDDEDDEAHAAADDEAQASGQDRLDPHAVVGEAAEAHVDAVRGAQSAHLGALARGGVDQEGQHGVVEDLEGVACRPVLRFAGGQTGFRRFPSMRCPVAQSQDAY
jgi:hypothetical protein